MDDEGSAGWTPLLVPAWENGGKRGEEYRGIYRVRTSRKMAREEKGREKGREEKGREKGREEKGREKGREEKDGKERNVEGKKERGGGKWEQELRRKGRKRREKGREEECTHLYICFGCCFWRVVFGVHSVNLNAHLSPLVILRVCGRIEMSSNGCTPGYNCVLRLISIQYI